MAYRRWTDEQIIEEFRALFNRGVPMTCKGVGGADRALFQAALYHFGTLKKVLQAAKLPWANERIWNKGKIVAEIMRLHAEGVDLSASRVTYTNGGLHQAAIKSCGSWKNAMSLAGIIPREYCRKTVEPRLCWTDEDIINRLRALEMSGVGMSAKGIGTADYKLYLAAKRHFGDLSGALEMAGLHSVDRLRRSTWTDRKVITEIQRLKESGEDLSCIVAVHNHSELYRAGCKYFGTWTDTLTKAGIDPQKVRKRPYYTNKQLLGELKRLYDKGEPVNAGALRKRNASLANRLRGRFGSHEAALRAAGLNPSKTHLR